MKKLAAGIADNPSFQSFTLAMILATALTMGLEAVPDFADRFGDLFLGFSYAAQGFFIFEIIVRLLAEPKLKNFFKDGWNKFDFSIVALSLVPAVGSFVLIGRLLRLLRVLRVLSVSDRMRGFMDRLMESADEVLYASAIAALLAYIYAVAGFYLFVDIDPAHWGTLTRAILSVFYLALLQDVPGFVEPLVSHCFGCIIYFVLFYITFIGLLIGVIAAALPGRGAKKS